MSGPHLTVAGAKQRAEINALRHAVTAAIEGNGEQNARSRIKSDWDFPAIAWSAVMDPGTDR